MCGRVYPRPVVLLILTLGVFEHKLPLRSCHEGRGANIRGIISLLKLKGDFRLIDTLKKWTVGSLLSDND